MPPPLLEYGNGRNAKQHNDAETLGNQILTRDFGTDDDDDYRRCRRVNDVVSTTYRFFN